MVVNNSIIVSSVFFVVSILLLLATFYGHDPNDLSKTEQGPPSTVKATKQAAGKPVEAAVPAAAAPAEKAPAKAAPKVNTKPRYVFVDLGANSADSLETFLKHKGAKFDYDFPKPDWAKHTDAEIFLFEANPHFNPALVEAKEKYSEKNIPITIFPSTVVDVIDGTRTFYLDTVNTGNDFWGSSTHADHPDAQRSHANGTELSAINISRWMLMNFLPRDFVVVKMDIEGAEYEVVPHMVEMGAYHVIDHMFIEWHAGFFKGEEIETKDKQAKAALKVLEDNGVNMPAYDSGA